MKPYWEYKQLQEITETLELHTDKISFVIKGMYVLMLSFILLTITVVGMLII